MNHSERYDYAHMNQHTRQLLRAAAIAGGFILDIAEYGDQSDQGILVKDDDAPRVFNSLRNPADATALALNLNISTEWVPTKYPRRNLAVAITDKTGPLYVTRQDHEGLTDEQMYCKAVTEAAAWFYRRPMKDYS